MSGHTRGRAPYEVQRIAGDAARPYAVVATFRSFNKVIARYFVEQAAKRRARDMCRVSAVGKDSLP